LLGGEAPDRETNRAVGELIRAPERPQDIRRLEARRSAGRARGHRHVLDSHDQRLALDEIEADVEVSRYAPLEVAVDVDLLHVLDSLVQRLALAEIEAAFGVSRFAPLEVAFDVAPPLVLEAGERPAAQGADAPALGGHLGLRVADRLAHATIWWVGSVPER